MRTAIVSDLHLGSGSDADLVRRPEFADRLFEAIDGAGRVVLLGDLLELRDRPLAEVLALSAPFFGGLAELVGDGEVVLVPGNHDHHLIASSLERRALADAPALGIEECFEPAEGALAALARGLGRARTTVAYPGLWLGRGVYATHGHFLDRHLTVPTFERLGIAVVERLLGLSPRGLDRPEPPGERPAGSVEDYERVQAPVYAFLHQLAQAGAGAAGPEGGASLRAWQMLGGAEGRPAGIRGWLLGSVALPGAIGVANRLGLGPVRADLSPRAIAKASLLAIGEVIRRLGIEAEHVIFGHTHRPGPLGAEPGWSAGPTRLWNTGSWAYSPGLLGRGAAESPYWPGTVGLLDGGGEPGLVHVLDGLERADLEG
jgi:Calcineurin-like phosphoesterase